MRTYRLFGLLALAVLFHLTLAIAQDTKIPKVGVILQGGSWYEIVDGLRDGLGELGFIEGKHFVLDIHDTHGDLKAVEEAARNLEQQKVSLIYTLATSVSLAAKQATENIPIVFVAGTNPVTVKLVQSIPKPGGRLTGVQFRATDLTGKRLELLREIVPNLRRVVTFYNPQNLSAIESSKEARKAAGKLGLELIERHVGSIEELQTALQTFRPDEAEAYIAISDAMIDSQIQSIIDMARAKNLPTMLYDPGAVAKGGLATYSADFKEIGRVSAKYVRRVLAGTSPSELPVEGIDKVFFVINLKTARQIGLTIPESILLRATDVIE
jgi:putative tryptophan/tyrosine transport system substrate-binding protein